MRDRFDDLARSLAGGTSRREALRGLGFGLGALLLTPLGARRSEALSDCAQFCASIFSPGPERGECVSLAAHCAGGDQEACAASLCHICGPASTGDRVVCGPEGSPICCAEGEDCLDGECGGCASSMCPALLFCGQDANGACITVRTVEGDCVCVTGFECGTTSPCATSAECGPGAFCQDFETGCCSHQFPGEPPPTPVCAPLCGNGATALRRQGSGGRTNIGP